MVKIKTLTYTFLVSFFFFSQFIYSNTGFQFYGENDEKVEVNFKLINNLIVFPLSINDKELHFILDTGVNKNILFSLYKADSLELSNIDRVILRGLGKGDPINALRSRNNTFSIKNLKSLNEDLFVILGDKFNLSAQMGVTIHGIIGYSLLKDVVLYINYRKKKLVFYNPEKFDLKKCRKCQTFPISLVENKPFIDAKVKLSEDEELIDVKLLIDSGGSDALWLFEDSDKEIKPPNLYFDDLLGEGLSGAIFGKRSRLAEFKLGKFSIKSPTVSYLDTLTTKSARTYEERNGSLGGNILKRFKVWLDYRENKLTLRKNGSFTSDFNYNMSGMYVEYHSKTLVKEIDKSEIKVYNNTVRNENPNNAISLVKNYKYVFKPVYHVGRIVKGSPADMAGVKEGDLIISINSKMGYDFKLKDINSLLHSKDKKKISLRLKRNEKEVKAVFRLKKKI